MVRLLLVGIGKSWQQLPDKAQIRFHFGVTVSAYPLDTFGSPAPLGASIFIDLKKSDLGILKYRPHSRNIHNWQKQSIYFILHVSFSPLCLCCHISQRKTLRIVNKKGPLPMFIVKKYCIFIYIF